MKKTILTLALTLISILNTIGQNGSIFNLLEGKWELDYSECDSLDNHTITFLPTSDSIISYDYRRDDTTFQSGNSVIETIGDNSDINYITDIDRTVKFINENTLVLSSGRMPDIDCDYHYKKIQTTTSTENLDNDISINVYPNPSTGLLNISSIKNTGFVYIYSIDGGICSTYNYNTGNTKINLSLSDGIYGVVLADNSGKIIKTDKIIIKK